MTKMLKVVGASWFQTKISSYILGTLGVLAIIALFLGEIERIQDDGNYSATVFWSEKAGYHIEYWGQSNELSSVPRGAARAYYRQDIDTTGWSLLELETDGSYPDHVQAYAAGLLEGALTWESVHAHLAATVHAQCANIEKDCERVRDQLERAATVDKNKVALYEDNQPFWHQVGLFYTQIDGIYTGWKHGVERSQKDYEIEKSDLYWLNAISEIKEMKQHLNISLNNQVAEQLPGLSSAFLMIVNETIDLGQNVTGVNKKLLLAHNKAGSYGSMIRILKRYKLNYHLTDEDESPLVPGSTVEFPSYPAAVTSHDDMYFISGSENHLIAVTGTTINNFNKKLWKTVNIVDQVPVGPRVAAANHLANNVSHWVHMLASNNSGTGCKQWMVVDLKRLDSFVHESNREIIRTARLLDLNMTAEEVSSFVNVSHDQIEITSPIEDLSTVTYVTVNKDVRHTVLHRVTSEGHNSRVKGLFWLVEQVPGYAHSGDLSDALLEQGYWATYGLPFFKDITEITHLSEKEALYGEVFSSSNSPRARYFKRASELANNVTSLISLMRNNNLTTLNDNSTLDNNKTEAERVLDERNYWVNIAVRGDLARDPRPYGVIDTKVFSYDCISQEKESSVVSGPTFTLQQEKKKTNEKAMNKGNVALLHHDNYNVHSATHNDEYITKEATAEEKVEKNIIPPFQWSKSLFANHAHDVQPDKWEFGASKPVWAW